MTALLEVTSLDLYYADAQALADVSLKISKGWIQSSFAKIALRSAAS
jgi:ABC-type branched-subunit amino acid transport system ATPase component